MAPWSALTDYLVVADGACRLTWGELTDIVGPLPPSATRHRARWSGDRPHVGAWRSAGFRVSELVLGQEVTFIPDGFEAGQPHPRASMEPETSSSAARSTSTDTPTKPDIILISCSKPKLDHPAPARDLYVSPLFRDARSHAERSGKGWFILSAEHGLVAPDEWLAPYERYLPKTSADFRSAWGHWVVERLDLLVGGLRGMSVEVHAGSAYVDPIADRLTAKGCRVDLPLVGLRLGARGKWYAERREDAPVTPLAASTARSSSIGGAEPQAFADLLRDDPRSVTPADFLERGPAGLKVPGLYSWWADEAGAADLSTGLGESVEAGMIYAGLAGATRWPSGRRSTNTLWSRIAGMHLGKRHEFSTFRRSLGAVHAGRLGASSVDESALTAWMGTHLRVLAAPYEDGDTLGHLETEVLRLLDLPLNLQGMPASPVRRRLTQLRRAVNAKSVGS